MRCTYYSGIFQVTEMLVVEHVHFLLLYTAIFLRCIIFLQISRISLGPQKLRPQNFRYSLHHTLGFQLPGCIHYSTSD